MKLHFPKVSRPIVWLFRLLLVSGIILLLWATSPLWTDATLNAIGVLVYCLLYLLMILFMIVLCAVVVLAGPALVCLLIWVLPVAKERWEIRKYHIRMEDEGKSWR